MKRIVVLCACLLMMLSSLTVNASTRIICEVDMLSENSARITLLWSDTNKSDGLMIAGWAFEDNQLIIYYKAADQLGSDYASREITSDQYTFPMKVLLRNSEGFEQEFSDVAEEDPSYGAIANLYYRGIIGGYPDGSFQPEKNVTRAEFSKMLLVTAGYELQDLDTIFSDVKDDFWAKPYIMTLNSKKIMNGKGEGLFDPNGQITLGEVITVLTRTFDLVGEENAYSYSLGETHWSNQYFLDAVKEGIVNKTDAFYQPYTPNELATRKDCAMLLSRILEKLHSAVQ